jgi:hypothetical protein
MALSLCSQSVANTGELACDKSRGIPKKIMICNGSFSSSDYATASTLFAKLVTNSKLSKSSTDKVFVLNEAQDVSDASDSNKEGSLGLGFKTVLIEGKPAYKIKMFAGADLLKRLRTFNNQTVRILEFDSNNTLWGTKSGTSFIGFQAKLFFTGNKVATGQNVEEGIVEFSVSILNTSEYFDNPYWTDLSGNNIEDVKALIDVPLSYVSKSSNVYKIAMKVADSNLVDDYNIFDDYGALIAALTFTAFTGATYGTSLAITSVAVDNTLKCLTVTFDSTAFSALSSGASIKLVPPTPATMDAADVTNVELLPVIVTK